MRGVQNRGLFESVPVLLWSWPLRPGELKGWSRPTGLYHPRGSKCLAFCCSPPRKRVLISIGPLDYCIIAIYFVVVLGIGIYLKKFASTGEDFFMAGRKMTAWIAGLSFISANLSSLETMGWSAMAYQYGMLGAHAYLIGAIPAILFLAIVMMPFYYICKTHSVPGYLSLRYDRRGIVGGHFFCIPDGPGERGKHVRHGQDPPPALGLGHERRASGWRRSRWPSM